MVGGGGLCVLAAGTTSSLYAQDPATEHGAHVCECGAHPPGPPRDRAVEPYAGEPEDLSPYAKFAAPYDLNYIHPNIYTGAGRDIAGAEESDGGAHRFLRTDRA